MASLSKIADRKFRISFMDVTGSKKRHRIRLPEMTKRKADDFLSHIKGVIASRCPVPHTTNLSALDWHKSELPRPTSRQTSQQRCWAICSANTIEQHGHSVIVQRQSYAQVTDDHFEAFNAGVTVASARAKSGPEERITGEKTTEKMAHSSGEGLRTNENIGETGRRGTRTEQRKHWSIRV